MIATMDAINWVDVLVFIPIYGTFLIAFFLGLTGISLASRRIA